MIVSAFLSGVLVGMSLGFAIVASMPPRIVIEQKPAGRVATILPCWSKWPATGEEWQPR